MKDIKRLNLNSTFSTLAITCFSQQLIDGEEALFNAIKNISSNETQIVAIKHDKSSNTAHYHIVIRLADNKKRKKVSSMLKQLNIAFDSTIDANLLEHRALESCGSFPAYVNYLLHSTPEAKQEGKAKYSKSALISNLTKEEIDQVLAGYTITKHALTKRGLTNLIEQARSAGYNRQNLDSLIASFNILALSASQETQLRKAYKAGIETFIRENQGINRLCIEISYPKASSDSDLKHRIDDAILKSVEELNVITTSDSFPASGVDATTDCLIFFNRPVAQAGEFDQINLKSCYEITKPFAAKRSAWLGDFIISTHDEAVDRFYKNSNSFLCSVLNNQLLCKRTPSTLLSEDEKAVTTEKYKQFRDRFNANMKNTQKKSRIELADINDSFERGFIEFLG